MFRRPLHPLIGPLAALAVLVASFAVAYWAPWSSDTRERELEYLETLSAWLAEVPQRGEAPDECIANFDRRVGEAPSQRIRPAARIARAGCAPARSDTHWLEVEWDVQSNLIDSRFAAADTTPEPGLATVVRDVVHTAHVNCWLGDDWEPLVQEWGIFARGEFWGLLGFADKPRRAIHLSPEVCDPLHRFFKSSYTP